ncbi:protein-tyrosine phosphatase-like protein [Lipomyces arxii]|uniref:protein-tyrosine phosphatase-like protein n=1 Tax=Lipomyces arxii TaxID=56418 RepID=UPI0034CE4332
MASSMIERGQSPHSGVQSRTQSSQFRHPMLSLHNSFNSACASSIRCPSSSHGPVSAPMTPPPQTPAAFDVNSSSSSFFDMLPPPPTPKPYGNEQHQLGEDSDVARRSNFSSISAASSSFSLAGLCANSASLSSISPASSTSSMSSLRTSVSKTSSEFNADVEAIIPICPAELGMIIASKPSKITLLDVRPYAQYSVERIKGAVNICVPSTLLKRPAFTVPKILDSLSSEQKMSLSSWATSESIIVYDSNTSALTNASIAFQVARKFLHEESFHGQIMYLKGGICEFSQLLRDFVEFGDLSTPTELPTTQSSARLCESKCVPILSGLRLPVFSKKQPVNPFFSNIRQNMDLLGGVGDPIPVRLPSNCTESKLNRLPRWLKDVVCTPEGAQRIADRFLDIEKAEKGRLESAFSSMCVITNAIANVTNAISGKSEEQRYSISAALERGNKNRYNNIFPYDHTRVKLTCNAGSCDYINASFICTKNSEKRYIATQGPLPNTFADFWSVVWDQNVRVIVMLTPTQEGGQVKCHPYWEDTQYGSLILQLLSEQETLLSPITGTKIRVRKFSLSNTELPFSSLREITHIQYVSWPDLGAPADPVDLVALSLLSGKCNASESNEIRPVVVHCSAGCGRTGTFCAVDSVIDILERKKEYGNCDKCPTDDLVAEVVHDLRTRRLSMVQCLRQFVICYESVLVWKLDQIDAEDKAARDAASDAALPFCETAVSEKCS